ncbi:MAG: glutamyl-tRNA reductase [Candidatus Brocadiales bacterium]
MNLLVVGLNHKSAPIDVRERLAFTPSKVTEALELLRKRFPSCEVVIISTCNRVELYACSPDDSLNEEAVMDFLSKFHGIETEKFREHMYCYGGQRLVRHLFHVSSSLDSMVVGESQIVSQVKEAYMVATSCELTGRTMHQLFQQALGVAKAIHSNSRIAQGKVSISSVAVEFAEKIFQDFSDKTVFIIGAGEMAELVLKSLVEHGARTVMVSNRSFDRAVGLAEEFGGNAVRYDDLTKELCKADIVISSTAAPHYVLHPDHVRAAMQLRKGNPIFLIDIAVPRDINPEVGRLDNVYLYNIDDLQYVVNQNVDDRAREMEKCTAMVEEEVERFMAWVEEMKIGPTIANLRQHFHAVGREELDRLRTKLGDVDDTKWQEVVYSMERTLNKLLHEPAKVGKQEAKNGNSRRYVETIKKLFGIRHADRTNSSTSQRSGSNRNTDLPSNPSE